MKYLATVSWAVTIEIDLPKNSSLEKLTDILPLKKTAAKIDKIYDLAYANLQKFDGEITDLQPA